MTASTGPRHSPICHHRRHAQRGEITPVAITVALANTALLRWSIADGRRLVW